jgi:HK97 gp10 family phage protein
MRVENWHTDIITTEIEKLAMDRLEKAGEIVATAARAKVPVGNNRPLYNGGAPWTERIAGTLRNSIRVVRLKGDPNLDVRIYAGWERSHNELTAYYGHMVEFGTSKMKAKPFLRPALNGVKSAIMNIMEGK